MMNTPVEMIKQLRAESGAGIMECRKALEQVNLDFGRALARLQETAASKAARRTEREALEGTIELYSHNQGRIGVMVEINTETEFAGRSETFRQFAGEIAMQITAASPLYVREEEIPQVVLDEQAQAAAKRGREADKPPRAVEQMVSAALETYKDRYVLIRQKYIRDETITVAQLLNQAIGQIGENIIIRRFVRWEIRPDESS